MTLRIIWHRILLDIWNSTKVRQSTPERPEMLRAWAKPFGPLAKAIFHPLSSGTGIIRSNHAIQISTPRTEGAELLPPLSRKGGSLEERRDVLPRSLQEPFFKCLGLLHDTYDLRTQLWFSHGLKAPRTSSGVKTRLAQSPDYFVGSFRLSKTAPVQYPSEVRPTLIRISFQNSDPAVAVYP